ncbi:MAG: helix-turn-helix domain-containing protein [Varibaculum timonense]
MTNKELQKRIGKNLQQFRKAKGYKSANAFADKAGEARSSYVEYEQGRVALPAEKAWKFADVLNCTLDELLGRNFPRPVFGDPRQEKLNGCYENMNDSGQQTLVSVAQGLEKDPANRIIKDSPEHLETKKGA